MKIQICKKESTEKNVEKKLIKNSSKICHQFLIEQYFQLFLYSKAKA